MKKLLISLVLACNLASANDTITLEAKNTLIFRNVFTGESVANAQVQAIELASHLAKDEPLYLYLDTPGGSVYAGEQLITTLKSLNHKIKTITGFAASMGFITAQSLGERLITQNGILMSHRAKIGVEGQMPGEFNNQVAFWSSMITSIETSMAARMELSLADYQSKVHDEYWTYGANAVADKAADKVVNVQCGDTLKGSYDETFNTMFGPVNVTWSSCPLISGPLKISFSSLDTLLITDTLELDRLKRTMFETLTNKTNFVKDPVLQESYYKYVK